MQLLQLSRGIGFCIPKLLEGVSSESKYCEAAAIITGCSFVLPHRHPAAAATVHLVRLAATPSATTTRLQHTHHFDVVTAPDRAPLHHVRLARNLISAQSAPPPIICVLECPL
jgi:hypothetical protein